MQLDYEMIGKRIKRYRKKKRMTQAQLAESTGLSDVYIRYIETAKRTPTMDTYVSIANVLECSMDDLLDGFLVCQHDPSVVPTDIKLLLADCNGNELESIAELIVLVKRAFRAQH